MKCHKSRRAKRSVAQESGYTLVELAFAVLAIGFIIIFLASTLVNIMATYSRGVWLNQMNAAARQMNEDIAMQLRFSGSVDTNAVSSGRLCVGNVVYAWRKGSSIDGIGDAAPNANLIRAAFKDSNAASPMCNLPIQELMDAYIPANNPSISVLIGNNVDVLRFDAEPVISDTDQLVKFQIVLSATGNNRATETSPGIYTCEDASGPNQYCAFTNLKFTVYRRN